VTGAGRPDPVRQLFLELHSLRRKRYDLRSGNSIAQNARKPPPDWPPRPRWLVARTAIQDVLSLTVQVGRGRATAIGAEEIPELYAVLTVVWVLDHTQCDRFADLYEMAMTFRLAGDHPSPAGIDLGGPPPVDDPMWPAAEVGAEPAAEEPELTEPFDTLVRPELLLDRLRDEIEDAESRAVRNDTASRRLVVRLSPGDFESYAERHGQVIRAIVDELKTMPVYAGDPPGVDLEPFSELGRGEFEFAFEPAAEASAPEPVAPPRPVEWPMPAPPIESPRSQPPASFRHRPPPPVPAPPPEPEPEPEPAPQPADYALEVDPEDEAEPQAPARPPTPPVFDRGLFARRPEQRPGP
jgi:hypothetical protein